MLIVSFEYKPVIHIILCIFFLMYVATIQHLKVQRTRIKNTQFAVYISDTSVTLKQSEGHQTYNCNVDLKLGYNNAKFERSRFNGAREKANVIFFFYLVVK